MVILYGIGNCDACKKARRWLTQNAIDFRFHDFRIDGLTPEMLAHFADHLSWEVLINRSSTSWRQLDAAEQADLNREKSLQLMLNTPTLIKRPILDTGKQLFIGFKSGDYPIES